MYQMNIPNFEAEILASTIRRQNDEFQELIVKLEKHRHRLTELMEGIEKRDLRPEQVRDVLDRMTNGCRVLKKTIKRWELSQN